jgi:hypothetical protein
LAFLDSEQEEIAPEAPEPPRRRPGGPERRRQQYLVRRLIGVGVGLAFLILVVVGIRGCLEARSDRGLRNYTQDVSTAMQESEQRGKEFFETLQDPGTTSEMQLEQKILGLRGASESLLNRANEIDVPDQMKDAQAAVVLSLRLRRDAMQTIGENIGKALGTAETADARATIQQEMGALFSSDVLWTQVGAPEIESVLDDEGLDAPNLPDGTFMPHTTPDEAAGWLTAAKLNEVFAGFGGTDTSGGSHGSALLQTSIGGTTLSADSTTTVASDAREVEIQVQNQGDTDESGVTVTVTLSGSDPVTEQIPSVAAGDTASVKLVLPSLPQPGTDTTLDVVVEPVPDEIDNSNNQATYPLVFGSA